MLQKGGEADREGLGKLLHRRFALKQAGHDRAPGGIGERVEDGVERSWLVRHMVNYIAWFAGWQSFCALGKKRAARGQPFNRWRDRPSVGAGESGSVRVDIGGR